MSTVRPFARYVLVWLAVALGLTEVGSSSWHPPRWREDQVLVADDPVPGDNLGSSVAATDNLIVVGAPDKSIYTAPGTYVESIGAVHVFARDGDSWALDGTLLPDLLIEGYRFGESVAISRDMVMAASTTSDYAGNNIGAVYVFMRGDEGWEIVQILWPREVPPFNGFGVSVCANDRYLAVGAPYDDDRANWAGAVHLYKRSGSRWQQIDKLYASDGAQYGRFGTSLAMTSDTMIVGADESSYVLERDEPIWIEVQKLVAADPEPDGGFGRSVAVDGQTIAVGAPYRNYQGYYDTGAVYVFEKAGVLWSQTGKALVVEPGANKLGWTVAVDEDTVFAGGREHWDTVVAFRYDGRHWRESERLAAKHHTRDTDLGCGMAHATDMLIVGACNDSYSGEIAGSATIFAPNTLADRDLSD
jgi:hypothetical protein